MWLGLANARPNKSGQHQTQQVRSAPDPIVFGSIFLPDLAAFGLT